MLINLKRGLGTWSVGLLLTALGASAALAQQPRSGIGSKPKGKAASKTAAPAPANPENNPLILTPVAVKPTDAVIKVNGEDITRQQLADECVATHGKEIADTLIARKLIEQALKAKKLQVTSAEVNEEIERNAAIAKTNREVWLRTLEKERGISPSQYTRSIIYPTIALRKLAIPRVQVTENDLRDAFEASFGEKIRCRVIMLSNQRRLMEIWNELHKNPGAFENFAKSESIDPESRAVGGLVAQPIGRHASPRNVSDEAFAQLVDGDPKDKDPSHKPKNDEISGVIQMSESVWILLKREELMPGDPTKNIKDPAVRDSLKALMFEEKLKIEMSNVYEELADASEIENRLTGSVKVARGEEKKVQLDEKVKLMSDPDAAFPESQQKGSSGGTTTPIKRPLPPGAPVDDIKNIKVNK